MAGVIDPPSRQGLPIFARAAGPPVGPRIQPHDLACESECHDVGSDKDSGRRQRETTTLLPSAWALPWWTSFMVPP
jgi:hypothetical protein